jgi:lipoprotein-releasing system permease protein
MIAAYERMIAWRYLRPKRGEGGMFLVATFSLLGIMLGVAALVLVTSVMNGFRAELLGRILGVNGHALVLGYNGRLEEWQPLLEKIRATPGIIRATPMIERQLMATRQNNASGVILRGMFPDDLKANPLLVSSVTSGTLDAMTGDAPVVAIGAGLARQLYVKVGDSITLISPEGNATPFGTTPRISSFEIGAIVTMGVSDYDKAFVFMPMQTAQNFFNLGSAVGGIDMMTRDADQVEAIIAPLAPSIPKIGQLYTWKMVNKALFDALQVERRVVFFVVAIIILVAAFNIISSLIMLVQSKMKDIAILRTMGATRGALMRLFMLAGTSIGLAGIASGLVIGFIVLHFRQSISNAISALAGVDIFNPEIYFLYELPAKVDWMQIGSIVLLAIILVILATIYPSWKAANSDPVKVLRYE